MKNISVSAEEFETIKAIRSAKESEKSSSNIMAKSSSRKKGSDEFSSMVSPANHRFANYLEKNNEIKFACLEHEMNFRAEKEEAMRCFMAQCTRLMDNRPYFRECKALGVKPLTLATHIAFRGKTCINKVIKNCIVETIGTAWNFYTEDFLPVEMLKMSEDFNAENCASC